MTKIAVGEQEQAAGAIIKKTAAHPYPTPYQPSWIDRLTYWVERLPGPAWLFYLSVVLVLILIRAIVAWSDGSLPVGTFFPNHIFNAISSVYWLLVLHYLDDRANVALSDFRPVLNVDDAGYEGLRYQLTTMPARPVLIWSFVGLVFGIVFFRLPASEAQLQLLKVYTSPIASVLDYVVTGFSDIIGAAFIYHTVRQLRLVSRIYTQHTRINIFETGPLYALSRVSAISAIAVLLITYVALAFAFNWQLDSPTLAIGTGSSIIIAFVMFVWPLLGAHRLLQQEKSRWKSEVARRMESVSLEVHRRTDAGDFHDMAGLNDATESLVRQRDVLEKTSTWPWDPDTVRLVATALLLPVVLWAITRVLERLGF